MDLTPLRQPEPETWRWFLHVWHGELQGYSREELQDVRLPKSLVDYYAVAGRLTTANLHLVPPTELVGDGAVRFLVEEQGVYSFETRGDLHDPPVWLVKDGSRTRLGEPLSRFLLQYTLFEAAITGHEGGWGYAERAALSDIASVMPALPLDSWPHPGGQLSFYAGEDLVGLAWDADGSRLEVWAAAHAPEPIRRLNGLIDWDG